MSETPSTTASETAPDPAPSPRSTPVPTAFVVWTLRAVWVVVALSATAALDDATRGATTAVRWTLAIGAWGWWGASLAALVVLGGIGLSVIRIVIPAALAVAITAMIVESGVSAAVFVGASLVATVLVATPEMALAALQASAYGSEKRFPLRPPVAFLAPMALAWVALVGSWMSGPLLVADRRWIPGILLTVVAVGATVVLGASFHRFSRRFVVLVPAGVVLHDPVVMVETVLVRRPDIGRIALADAGTTARDLTGVTWGPAVEVVLSGAVPLVARPERSASPRIERPDAVLIAPSRPGAFLAAARAARLP